MSDSEPRDWWSKAEIVTKIISSIAAVFLPVALLMVSDQFNQRQRTSDEKKQEAAALKQQDENIANRLPKLIQQLSSNNPIEKELSLQSALYLATKKQLPPELMPVLTSVATSVANNDKNKKTRDEVRKSLLNAAEQNPAFAPEIKAKLSTLVYLQIATEAQREKAIKIQSDLIQNKFSAPGIENVSKNKVKIEIPNITEVRYFRDEDKTQIEKIKNILKSNGITTVREDKVAGTDQQIEIWFSSDI